MQRAARFLLWFGLALVLISIVSCGAGCVAGVGSVVGDNPEGAAEGAAGAALISMLTGTVGLLMIIVGAILRAFAPKSREAE